MAGMLSGYYGVTKPGSSIEAHGTAGPAERRFPGRRDSADHVAGGLPLLLDAMLVLHQLWAGYAESG